MKVPTIHLVRHAQGFHNLGHEFHSLPDPKLTPLGEEQCAALQKASFPPPQTHFSLIAASPLSRTLHTAYLTFKPALSINANSAASEPSSGASSSASSISNESVGNAATLTSPEPSSCPPYILAIPDVQETSDYPCDTGSDLAVLEKICATNGWPVDLSLLSDGWNDKSLTSRYSPAADALKIRARAARLLLRSKARDLAQANPSQDIHIALVTHGGYLHYLTDDWEEVGGGQGTGWTNCETRTFQFESDFATDDDSDAHLVETVESRSRRGKPTPPPTRQQQQVLFEQAIHSWEQAGLQNATKIGKGEKSGRVVPNPVEEKESKI